MIRGEEIILKNRSESIKPPKDNDVHIYAKKGNIYYRVGNGSEHILAGKQFITTNITGGSVTAADTRGGKVSIPTAGSTYIEFDTPLGTTGDDYNLFFFVRDTGGAQPSWDVTGCTKYGFTAITYDDNVVFGWKAELKTQ